MTEAAELLKETGDPQKADMRLDRAWFEEMAVTAKESRSPYLQGYVALMADAANLRTAVRASRMGLDEQFVVKALVPGGTVKEEVFRTTKAADLAGAFCLLLSSVFGIPVSTTHTKTSAIMGVGAVKRLSAINFGVVKDMVLTWIFTFPGCGLISFVMAKLFMLLF